MNKKKEDPLEKSKAGSVAMRRIMKEFRDMRQKKQVYTYAEPLEVSMSLSLFILLLCRLNHSNGISQLKDLKILSLREGITMD